MNKLPQVQLINPPSSTHRNPEENLGLEYIAAETAQNGNEVKIIDCWLSGKKSLEVVDSVVKSAPEVVGISPSMDNWQETVELVMELRKRHFQGRIVLGGIYASFYYKNILEDLGGIIDGIISGEADETFQQYLVERDIRGIQGAIYLREHEIIRNPGSAGIDNLDMLPFPTRAFMAETKHYRTPSHVMGSRGCYGNCSFCSVACYQKLSSSKNWRGRSPRNIVDEMVRLSKQGETMVKLVDDNFCAGGSRQRELLFAELLTKEATGIRFRLSLRANDVTEELIEKLKHAGLFAVSVGVESFVPRKLRDYHKGTTVEENLQALKVLKKYGIFTQMGFIMFDPFVTLEEIEQELDCLEAETWAVTKGICTSLFAAQGTPITERIQLAGQSLTFDNGNYKYEIIDPGARELYRLLRIWVRDSGPVYDLVTDPISAPKNISVPQMEELRLIAREMKETDIIIARNFIARIRQSKTDMGSVTGYLQTFYKRLSEIQGMIIEFYKINGLLLNANFNKRI